MPGRGVVLGGGYCKAPVHAYTGVRVKGQGQASIAQNYADIG